MKVDDRCTRIHYSSLSTSEHASSILHWQTGKQQLQWQSTTQSIKSKLPKLFLQDLPSPNTVNPRILLVTLSNKTSPKPLHSYQVSLMLFTLYVSLYSCSNVSGPAFSWDPATLTHLTLSSRVSASILTLSVPSGDQKLLCIVLVYVSDLTSWKMKTIS